MSKLALVCALVLAVCACQQNRDAVETARTPQPHVDRLVNREPSEVPSGAVLRMRLYTAVHPDSTTFMGVLSSPLEGRSGLVVPTGTIVRGSVLKADGAGRTALNLRLDKIEWNGSHVPIETNTITKTTAEYRKHRLTWKGPGALIEESAAGGKDVLIGAGVGGAAPAAGAAEEAGEVRIPVESELTFRLTQSIRIA